MRSQPRCRWGLEIAHHNPLDNPEAGNHPLPTDKREVAAVLRATTRCYEAHPYFAARYGARGESFARSDGGYLTTLVAYPQNHVNEQVRWLAIALACRGMPRWLMEVHLDFLYQELVAAAPKRTDTYHKLEVAARRLRDERHRWISQADFDTLSALFEASSGEGLKGAGELLVAAICDESCGIAEATPSLVRWLGDPERFSPRWCAAVSETLVLARAKAAQRRGTTL